MENKVNQITKLKENEIIKNSMVWNWKQGSTYENYWRDFLNQPNWNNFERVINTQYTSELWGWVTTNQIWVSPTMRVANILEAETDSWALDYTWSRGPDDVMRMLSAMLNAKLWENVFWPTNAMRTSGWTEAISLISEYFSDKDITQCWPWYFMQYWNWNNVKTLFNSELWRESIWDFKTLASIEQIEESTEKKWVIWIIQPWISWECYTEEEWVKILELAKEKECFVVIDTAFDWTEIERENTANFYKLSRKEWLLEKTIFFWSPSKGQGFPWKRQGFLATKNEWIINSIIKKAWENRDWLVLNTETNAMYTFLEIFDNERATNPHISVSESIDNVFKGSDPNWLIFSSIRWVITPELITEYIKWKNNFFGVMKNSLDIFKENTWEWEIFSWIWGEINSLFNIFLKIPSEISNELMKKYDINELIRYMFLYNWILVSPWQNFWWDKEYWNNKPIIFRGTLTQDPSLAIQKVKNSINFLLTN